jgi:hypothetical protein
MDEPFALPKLQGEPGEDGWTEEVSRYQIHPRPKPKFKTVLEAHALFDPPGKPGEATVTTRVRPPEDGEVVLDLKVELQIGKIEQIDEMTCVWKDGLIADRLMRIVGQGRRKEINYGLGPYDLPSTTYPEVLIPFLMRGQPHDKKRRALYAWTSDRFVARVYYESRGGHTIEVPAGKIDTTEVWMYPDLNDWVAMGKALTRLAKPLLPRYEMFFENEAPHRLVRFEGSFGPPGAPEMIIELAE